MPEQIYIGNFAKGLTLNRLPFNIDNDSFPTLFNFYVWRGRAKRKRGTALLGQLQRQIQSVAVPNFGTQPWIFGPLTLIAGAGNLITGPWATNTNAFYSLESSSTITPGSISFTVGGNTYTEPSPPDGTLLKNGLADPGSTINYATGAVTIAGGGVGPLTGTFSYFPGLPVMGLEDFVLTGSNSLYPILLAFDTKYSYQINQTGVPFFYNTTFYKNTNIPFTWTGADFQLFWTTNYSGALWATNNKPGLNFVNATYTAGSGTPNITCNFKSVGVNFTSLVVGDVLWFNEWTDLGVTINGLNGTISNTAGAAGGNYIVTFTGNQTVSGTGIAQLLTNSIPGQDGIKWYDGDPTSGTGLPTGTNLGWVNFAPPLTATTVIIDNLQTGQYYLVGALAILPFKDRLLFFAPWIKTSAGVQFQLLDTVLWSWNGPPYYNALTPTGETFDVTAYYVNQTGKGGYLPAGIPQPIVTIGNNEDVLLIGFGGDGRKTRFVYTGDDINPFLFFNINSEIPSFSTFSSVILDKGMIDIGQYGIAITDQQSCQRIDLQIPDNVFQIQALQNGVQRVNAIRDYFKEWIYFSYPITTIKYDDGTISKFPQQTFLYNYRDDTWAIFYESFTRHGTFRRIKKNTWATIGKMYKTWSQWREPWNSGINSAQFPSIIAGNAQGYVLIKAQGTGESVSGTITAITNSSGFTQITSINHCVSVGDYLFISGVIGTSGPNINGQIGKVIKTVDANTFNLDIIFPIGTYLGLGTFSRLSQPFLQTKQFPVYWNEGRQVRLSVQKYLLDFTADAQATVNIYLSQDPDDAWNNPINNPPLNSLIYTQILFTCPESTNIGLTHTNTNLQMPTAEGQFQIWHRINTSLIGNSFQVGVTLSDIQMRNLDYATAELTLHGMQFTVDRGPHLA